MNRKDISLLGAMLANPIRMEIMLFLINPDRIPKPWTDIKTCVFQTVDKDISDGALNWYLTNMQAKGVIRKNEDLKYELTPVGTKIALKIKAINDELK